MELPTILSSLPRFVTERYGAGSTVVDPVPLAGNSGQSLRFAVRDARERVADMLVVRWAPTGVPPVGHLDLERQAGFLRAAAAAGVPVPEVVFAANRSSAFPTATMITGWVRGESVPDWAAADRSAAVIARAVEILARIHTLPVEHTPARSDRPRSLRAEVDHWLAVAERSRSAWCGPLRTVASRLATTAPAEVPPAVTHGDFRLANLVVGDAGVRAVLDWELARSGPVWLDLAWFLMYLDAPWWFRGETGGAPRALRRSVTASYPASTGDLAWYEAAVRFKQAAIITYNHRLHVTGARPDPHWDRMLRAMPVLLDTAERLLAGGVTA